MPSFLARASRDLRNASAGQVRRRGPLLSGQARLDQELPVEFRRQQVERVVVQEVRRVLWPLARLNTSSGYMPEALVLNGSGAVLSHLSPFGTTDPSSRCRSWAEKSASDMFSGTTSSRLAAGCGFVADLDPVASVVPTSLPAP